MLFIREASACIYKNVRHSNWKDIEGKDFFFKLLLDGLHVAGFTTSVFT